MDHAYATRPNLPARSQVYISDHKRFNEFEELVRLDHCFRG